MTSLQRYWSGYCKRRLQDEGWLQADMLGKLRSTQLPVKHIEDRAAQHTAWLLESIYTAISHDEPVIALRAYAQAAQYFGWLEAGGHNPSGWCNSALHVARNRVEDLMERIAPLPSTGEAAYDAIGSAS